MRIFLSYASEQKGIAEPIAFSLRSRGHYVFLDKDDLPAGRSYDEQIQTAVEQSDVMIYLISPASVAKGRYTRTELEFARAAWRHPANRVLPVVIEPTDMSQIPNFLKGVTLLEPQGNVTAEVAAAIERLRGPGFAFAEVLKGAGICAGAFLALFAASELVDLPSQVEETIIVGVPTTAVLVLLARAWSWRALIPIVTVGLAFYLIGSSIFANNLVRVVQTFDISNLSDDLTVDSGEPASDVSEEARARSDARRELIERIEGQNSLFSSVNQTASRMAIGAALMLSILAGSVLAVPALSSPLRWLVSIAIASVATPIAFFAGFATVSYSLGIGIGLGFALFFAVAGALLGYWIARGQPT